MANSSTVHRYGEHESQWVRLTIPPKPWTNILQSNASSSHSDGDGCVPVMVLLHGGYWKQKWTIDNTPTATLTPDLAARGFAVLEVEYRRRDEVGGGWPGTNDDCLNALNLLKVLVEQQNAPLDLARVTIIGHSAGGTLALWVAAKSKDVVPNLVVAVAPVANLVEGYRAKVSDEGDAVELYMKCTPDSADGGVAYRNACPTHLLPVKVPTLITTGTDDKDVPPYFSLAYYAKAMEARDRATAGSVSTECPIELQEIPDADHYSILTCGNKHWETVITRVEEMLKV